MPIYEYTCEDCRHDCEVLIRGGEDPVCPQCGGKRLAKQFSVPAAHSAQSRALPVCNPGMSGGCGFPECGSGGCPLE